MDVAGVVGGGQARHSVGGVGGLGRGGEDRFGDDQDECGDGLGELPGVGARDGAVGPGERGCFGQGPPGVGGLGECCLVGVLRCGLGEDGRGAFDEVEADERGCEECGDSVGGLDLAGGVVEEVLQRDLRSVDAQP